MRRANLLVVLLVVTAISSCSVQAQSSAQIQDDDRVPFQLLDRDAPQILAPSPTTGASMTSLCFVDDDHLVEVTSSIEDPSDLVQVADALETVPEAASGSLRTAVTAGLVGDVGLSGGVAAVDLRPALAQLSGTEQLLVVGQLVCTLTSRPGVGLVSFTLDGTPVDVPRSDGSLTSSPVSRDDYAELGL